MLPTSPWQPMPKACRSLIDDSLGSLDGPSVAPQTPRMQLICFEENSFTEVRKNGLMCAVSKMVPSLSLPSENNLCLDIKWTPSTLHALHSWTSKRVSSCIPHRFFWIARMQTLPSSLEHLDPLASLFPAARSNKV
jgi:hypothetical protein